MSQKRRFTPEFKKEAVALVIEQDYTIAKAAESLGISSKILRTWVADTRHQNDSTPAA
ncbi:Transposase [compost metagenome]